MRPNSTECATSQESVLARVMVLLVFAGVPSHVLAQAWLQLNPTGTIPTARVEHTTVYDPTTNTLILYGGGAQLNDVWTLSNANGISGQPAWTQLNLTGGPAGRRGHAAVYDPGTNRMIIFGGALATGGYGTDVWVLLNANGQGGLPTWTQLLPSGTSPSPRRYLQAALDLQTNRMIIFGGESQGQQTNSDVWVLTNANGLGGTPAWIQLTPSGIAPSARAVYSAAYDNGSKTFMIFGGGQVYPYGTGLNDYWILTNANGLGSNPSWTQVLQDGLAGSPPRRNFANMLYDPTSNETILFGGYSPGCGNTTCSVFQQNDTWVLSNANGRGTQLSQWSQLSVPGVRPPPRGSAGASYDVASNRMTIFGGGNAPLFNDTWVLTNANGIVPPQLQITQVLTNHGGNAGTVTIELIGSGFQNGTTAKLAGAGPDIIGTNTSAPNSSFLTTTFDLTGATPGVRNVVVTNPDGTTATLNGGFTVEQGGAAQLWTQVVGRPVFRSGGGQQSFYITYGNRGSIDSGPATMSISFPNSLSFSLGFGNTSNQIVSTAQTSTQMVITVALRSTASGSTNALPIMISTLPGQAAFTINAAIRRVL